MFKQLWHRVVTWNGKIGRAEYMQVGFSLAALKLAIDYALLTMVFHLPWSWARYFDSRLSQVFYERPIERTFPEFLSISLVAVPFMYIGVVYTIKRCRDVGAPTWLAGLFFIPYMKFALIAILCALDSRVTAESPSGPRRPTAIGRFIPTGKAGSSLLGLLVSVVLTLPIAFLVTERLGDYGWTLFMGLPFFCGFSSALIYCYHVARSLRACFLVSLASVAVMAGVLLAVAIEGAICILMAAPIAVVMAMMGGALAYFFQRDRRQGTYAFAVLLFSLPSLAGAEHARPSKLEILKATSSIEIDAPPETVWKNVVSFSELPPPSEAIFKTGLAYPLHAEIHGHGVGAERHCVFSTGAFVEPITVWNEPTLLRFDVTQEPPPMVELSPFKIHPRHLDHYFAATQGEFRLTALPDGRTRLEGTTWYRLRFMPEAYWELWADLIVHRIHMRVLNHIKDLAEKG